MITCIADNIISPLGLTSGQNLDAVLAGRSELRHYPEGSLGLPEAFCGSLIDRSAIASLFEAETGCDAATRSTFEQLCILSASRAIASCGIDPSRPDVLFVISTTKANVDALARDLAAPQAYPSHSAAVIARHFANPNVPLVVSNACISGVCAQIAAVRALLAGRATHAVVIGADVLSRFIISGFQSFKALSPEPCRPYDGERTGLNLGEATGTIILTSAPTPGGWHYVACSVHNDANHISGPSRTGEGSWRVLTDLLRHVSPHELAFVNAHGTATAYNDEMESIALHRAGLDTSVPVNGLKGFYGHTLGAAGVIETILSMHACDRDTVLPTRGYSHCGTSHPLLISPDARPAGGRKAFLKILSGFGGCNAGIAYRKGGDA